MIPPQTKASIERYVAAHKPTGGFVHAVLSNDLSGAFRRADEENLANLYDIVDYCHWEIPGNCWGSPEKVAAWLAQKKEAVTHDTTG